MRVHLNPFSFTHFTTDSTNSNIFTVNMAHTRKGTAKLTCQQKTEPDGGGRSKAHEKLKAKLRAEIAAEEAIQYAEERDSRTKFPCNSPADTVKPPRVQGSESEDEGETASEDDEPRQKPEKVTKAHLAAALAYLQDKKGKKRLREEDDEDNEDPEYDLSDEEEEEEEDDVQLSQRKRGQPSSGKKAAVGSAAGSAAGPSKRHLSKDKVKKMAKVNEASVSKLVWRTHDYFKKKGWYGVADGEHGTNFEGQDPEFRKFARSPCAELGIDATFLAHRISQYMNSK
jgi:hypothetical protein